MRKILFFTLSLLFVSAAQAQLYCASLFLRDDFSASESFRNLAWQNKLLSQMDPALVKRGLVVPDGGLCASTCGVNVLRALYDYNLLSHDKFKADRRLRDIVRYAEEAWGVDARRGLTLEDLGNALEVLAERLGDFYVRSQLHRGFFSETDLIPPLDSLIVAQITTTNPEISHAIVILQTNPVDQSIVFSDPNDSGKITYTYYEIVNDPQGYEHFRIIVDPTGPKSEGLLMNILNIQTN
jgi:plasmid stabilization system protein ParE